MGAMLAVLEQRDGALKGVSFETLTAARALADARSAEVHALVVGPPDLDTGRVGTFGADRLITVFDANLAYYQPEWYAAAVAERISDGDYDAVLLAATSLGRDLGPRIAARADWPLAVDVTAVDGSTGFTLTRPVYSGKAIYTIEAAGPAVISVRPNVFAAAEHPRDPTVETAPVPDVSLRARTVEVKAPETTRLDVAEAPVVVSGGRGLREPEHFRLVEDLAQAFGTAAVGASRAVVDAGWRSHADQVGQTGKTVSPQLYIAIGISGAIQHLAGMRTSQTIVAINKDPDAPIFKVADYGIVGDLFEVVPKLTEAVREIRGT